MTTTSFIIVAYNEERTIGRCLNAILAQDHLADYEIIVIDDGSRDATGNVASKYAKNNSRISLHRLLTNQGRGAARAAGVQAAKGEYIAFVDSDIIIPPHWLSACFDHMGKHDAVGGIPVPDGDVNYVYTLLDLKPKIVKMTTIVSGSNGLYKKDIFKKITFNNVLRDGEDSVFNKELIASGFKLFSIRSLIVEHKEARRFSESLKWLYQVGQGASRQFKQFKEIRLPDLAYSGLIAIISISLLMTALYKTLPFLLLPLFYVLIVDVIHMNNKFFFEIRRPWLFIAGIVMYWPLLVSYFVGRASGLFKPLPKVLKKKKVLLCFDLEGMWGMPFGADYDIERSVDHLLNVMGNRAVTGVFFTVGKIIEEHPDMIRRIAKRGHAIALHGYIHEHLDKLSKKELADFSAQIASTESLIERITGKRPSGFRSPYLMAPAFSSYDLYKILKSHEYRWVSNREIRYPDELFRPDRIRIKSLWGKNNWLTRIILLMLNVQIILRENITEKKGFSRIIANIRWLDEGASPFKRHGIFEIPIHAPLDCDLLGFPKPSEDSPDDAISYAANVMTGGIGRKGELYTLTFHDWIIGTANRMQILEKVLDVFSEDKNIIFISSPENII